MNEEMDIPEHFDFIKDEDIPTIVERALKEGNPLYPVPKIMDKEDCTKVVKAIRGFWFDKNQSLWVTAQGDFLYKYLIWLIDESVTKKYNTLWEKEVLLYVKAFSQLL